MIVPFRVIIDFCSGMITLIHLGSCMIFDDRCSVYDFCVRMTINLYSGLIVLMRLR